MSLESAQVDYVEQFENLFVLYVFPLYHLLRRNWLMTYCFYFYLSLFFIHNMTKFLKRRYRKQNLPFNYKTIPGGSQEMFQQKSLQEDIIQIKSSLRQATPNYELLKEIQEQSRQIAQIHQYFLKFTTMQEEFQRSFIIFSFKALLLTQSKMLAHLSKSQSRKSNNTSSTTKQDDLYSNQKQDVKKFQNYQSLGDTNDQHLIIKDNLINYVTCETQSSEPLIELGSSLSDSSRRKLSNVQSSTIFSSPQVTVKSQPNKSDFGKRYTVAQPPPNKCQPIFTLIQ